MTNTLLRVSYFSVALAFVTGHGIEIILSNKNSESQFELTCKQKGLSTGTKIEWQRTDDLVLETHWNMQTPTIKYLNNGSDLSNRTSVSQSPTKDQQSIAVQIDGRDSDGNWRCCGEYWCIAWTVCLYDQCSDLVFVKVTTGPTTTTDGPRMPLGTTTPAIDIFVPMNGTLTLYSSMDKVTVDQLVTLSCTIDYEIEEENWIVFWTSDNTLILITSANSSIINPENLKDWLPSFLAGSGDINIDIQSFDELQNVTVSSNAFQQNITFLASRSLFVQSSWNCGNPFLNSRSNTLVISVIQRFTTFITSEGPVNTKPSLTSIQAVTSKMPVKTTHIVTSHQSDGESSLTTTIVAGSVSGAVAVVVLVVVILVLLWRRRKKNHSEKADNSGKTESIKENIMMEDNVLYAGSKDTMFDYDDERVMQANILYAGCKDNIHENASYQDDETVMEDNFFV